MNKLFDLRVIIAVLFAVFGIVVTITGFVANSAVSASGDPVGVNVNLWTGIPMLVLAVLFLVWALVRPVAPETPPAETETPAE